MELIEKLHTQITNKQHHILIHLFRFRFLNRVHIQKLMHHKDYKRINVWLKDLVSKGYINRIYTTSMPENTKPAVYYLAKYGRRVLLAAEPFAYTDFEEVGSQYVIENEHLKKLAKDKDRKEAFRMDCLAIADCYMAIDTSIDKENFSLSVTTHNDVFHYEYLQNLKPDLEIATTPLQDEDDDKDITEEDIAAERANSAVYFLYYVSNRKLRKYIGYRIAHVCNYVFTEDFAFWVRDDSNCSILFVTASIPLRNYAMGVVKRKLKETREIPNVTFKFTTLEEFKKHGLHKTPYKIIDASSKSNV